MVRSILTNSLAALISDLASRLLGALLLILVARSLGEAAAGTLTLSTNYTLILSAVVWWGLDQILIRDVAADKSLTRQYFVHFLAIRLILSSVLWLSLGALLLGIRIYGPTTSRFIVIASGTLVGNAISNLAQSVLIAHERMWPSAVISVLTTTVVLAVAAVCLSLDAGMYRLALLLLGASWMQGALLNGAARKYLHTPSRRLELGFCRHQLAAAFPFVPIGLFIAIETQLGAILLSFFRSEASVGLYGMANVVISSLALLSQALRVGIFPTLSRLFHTDVDQFVALQERSWRYLAVCSAPMVVLIVQFSAPILRLLYREAAPEAVLTLQCLAPTLLFYFVHIPNARLMILDGRQGILARFYAFSTALGLVLSLLLIPTLGAPAVGVARVVSMGVLFALNYAYVERHILPLRPWRLVWKPLAAAAIMALTTSVLPTRGSGLARGAIGMAVYGLAIVLLRAIPAGDWSRLRQRFVPRRLADDA